MSRCLLFLALGSAKPVPASQKQASQFATDANFAAVFGAGNVGTMPTSTQQPGKHHLKKSCRNFQNF